MQPKPTRGRREGKEERDMGWEEKGPTLLKTDRDH